MKHNLKRNPNRVCIANAKGGVGKSTTTIEIAAHAVFMGYRVLVVDLDPQANTSRVILGKHTQNSEKNLYHLLTDPEDTTVKEVLKKGSLQWPKTWVLPCNQQLSKAYKFVETLPDWSDLVDEIISQVEDSFDLVLIDTAPSMSTLTSMGMRACNKLLIPTDNDPFGDDGVSTVLGMRDYFENKGHHIDLVKVFIAATHKGGASAYLKHSSAIKARYPDIFADIELPHCATITKGKMCEVPQSGMSLLDTDHKLYRGYRRLTELIMGEK